MSSVISKTFAPGRIKHFCFNFCIILYQVLLRLNFLIYCQHYQIYKKFEDDTCCMQFYHLRLSSQSSFNTISGDVTKIETTEKCYSGFDKINICFVVLGCEYCTLICFVIVGIVKIASALLYIYSCSRNCTIVWLGYKFGTFFKIFN